MAWKQLSERLDEKVILIVFSLIPGLFLFLTHLEGMPLSYDFGGHISRVYVLLNDGMGWTDMWYNGHALLTFYPPLYHVMFALFGAISMDIVRPFSFGFLGVVSFLSMYAYSSKYISYWRSISSGILFLSGWMLYIAHISGSMPQAYAAALIPVFFSELERSLEGETPVYAGLLGGLIILFHHNAALVAATGAITLIILRYQENVLNALSAGMISIGVAGFWILPALQSYSDASYSLITNIGGRGMEDVVLLMPLFAVSVAAKIIGSLESARKYRYQALIGLIGVLTSFGASSVFTGFIPVIRNLPPYRFFVLTSFAASFLVSATDKRVLGLVLLISVISSGLAVQTSDDRGYYPGQKQAYEYLEGRDVDLLYDAEDTDLRAYGITVHGKDIADGWSIGSSPVRPGLMSFSKWQENEDIRAVEFLNRWSVTHIITYRDNGKNSGLHRVVNRSGSYVLDRCFQKTCIFESDSPREAVINYEKTYYVVNASKELPIPYSSRFNVTKNKSPHGFLELNEKQGRTAIKYVPSLLRPFGLFLSFFTFILIILGGRSDLSIPASYSKEFRDKTGL